MSSLRQIVPPAVLPLSLAEVRAAVRLEAGDADELLAGYLRSAVAQLDGAAGILGRCLVEQQWVMTLDRFPACQVIEIPLPPCQSVDELSYIDGDGATQVITDYVVYGIGDTWPARLTHAWGGTWPTTRNQGDAVQITFTAGYGPDWNSVPEPIRQAIATMVAASFDGCSATEEVSLLLGPYRARVW
jgi:uncharacterized phiE125 gp8 family phage protein